MSKIGKHISNIRGMLNLYNRTEESYTDEFIFNLLCSARVSLLIQEQKTNKISVQNYSNFCISLIETKGELCDCVPDSISCKVLRSKYKIPKTISSRVGDTIKVSLLSGKNISLTDITRWQYLKNETTDYVVSIINDYLYFWNLPLNIKVVKVYGLFNDLISISSCTEEGNECNLLDNDFPFAGDEHFLYKRTLELLQIPATQIQDITNDSNTLIKV